MIEFPNYIQGLLDPFSSGTYTLTSLLAHTLGGIAGWVVAWALWASRRLKLSPSLKQGLLALSLFFVLYGTAHLLTILALINVSPLLPWVGTLRGILLIGISVVLFLSLPLLSGLPQRAQLETINHELIAEIRRRETFERELRRAEEKYRLIFENAIEGIIQALPDGRYIAVNPAFAHMLGYDSPEEILNAITNIENQIYVNPEERQRFREAIDLAGSARAEFEAWKKDGAKIWLSVSARAVRNSSGETQYYESIVEDITARKHSEERLRQTAERLSLVTEAAKLGTWEWDLSTDTVVWNTYHELILGYVPGRPERSLSDFFDRVHPADREAIQDATRRALTERKDYRQEFRVVWPDGSEHWALSGGRGYYDAAGKPVRMMGTLLDITPLKQMHQRLHDTEVKLKAIVENSPSWVYMKDREGRYTLCNKIMEEYLGHSVLGKTDLEFFPPVIAEEHRKNDLRALSGDVVLSEERVSSDDDAKTYLSTKFPVRSTEGEIVAIGGISTDISERKRVLEELRSVTEDLRNSNRDLEQFAYIASHDLKEPLRTINTYLGLLTRTYGPTLNDEAKEFIQYTVDAARRMMALIESLLRYARVGRAAMQVLPIDANIIVQDILSQLRTLIHESKADVRVASLPTVMGDKDQLSLLVQNLISNAIKFTPSGTVPVVEVTAIQKDSEWIFSIRDNGIGINPEHRQRIFEVFRRLHPRDQYPGEGIGLATCKRIVERHGGRIWVESPTSGAHSGSTFFFSLPVRARSPRA